MSQFVLCIQVNDLIQPSQNFHDMKSYRNFADKKKHISAKAEQTVKWGHKIHVNPFILCSPVNFGLPLISMEGHIRSSEYWFKIRQLPTVTYFNIVFLLLHFKGARVLLYLSAVNAHGLHCWLMQFVLVQLGGSRVVLLLCIIWRAVVLAEKCPLHIQKLIKNHQHK